MLRLGIAGIISLVIALGVTNPGQEVHKRAIYTAMASGAGDSSMLGSLAGTVLNDLDLVPYQYNNYIVCSTMTLREDLVSVGAFNKVWNARED